jgi:lipoprotein-releasing system permease protein
MNFSLFIAKRYFIAKKSQNVINIITKIAITGVAIGTMALIVVLSAFNGIEELVLKLFNAFDPELRISIKEGKTFDAALPVFEKIKKTEGIAYYTEVLEENILLKYKDKQTIAIVKGVSDSYMPMSRLDTMLTDGEFVLQYDSVNYCVAGQGIAYNLGINLLDYSQPIQIYAPKRLKNASMNPDEAFKNLSILPAGIFSIQHDFDSKYILVPLSFARELLDYTTQVSAIEISLKPNANKENIQKLIQQTLGENYDVKDRYQQHDFLYKIMKSEKWAVFLILSFILIIATFNVIGSLSMLIIDKKKDLKILWNMGASTTLIRKIFFLEGLFISLSGAIIGLLAGLLLCLAQIHFKLIKLQGSFVMDSYPVKLEALDFILVFLTVMIIGIFAAWFPAKQITEKHLPKSI